MLKSAVYYDNSFLGEVEIYPQNSNSSSWIREMRISHLSPPSERCPPLAVLHTVAAGGVCFKMESKSLPSNDSPLLSLHATLATENKTAVIPIGDEELHLVAMPSRKNSVQNACFWGFNLPSRLYDSSLVMLNLRCLGIVFDLDETLLVANTMRSFEDRIDALQRKINNETDPQRIAGMVTEIKRYQEDKSILKQYAENDQIVENGKVFKVQPEMVPPLSDNHPMITRPVIRLQEKNIILTRVNPMIRDTSVLVRLRPAWEDLRSYLTARGRKRFEVYVCTMAERDYALEMWRLLDPESSLINSSKLLDRIVCVKSGSRKSLLNVFQDGICHPKMALVIDDRLKVWDEKDQSRVHVVPAFAPYYAPQAEANSSIPVLYVARNVACNVRGGFFKEFDEGILPRIGEVLYEDEIKDFPPAPDVGNFLISEDDTPSLNVNKDQLCLDGMADAEVERRMKEVSCNVQAVQPMAGNFGPRPVSSLQHVIPSSFNTTSLTAMPIMLPLPNNQSAQSVTVGRPLGQLSFSEPSFQASPAREEGEVPESELDPDTRRRLLILQHGQDNREPTTSFPVSPPLHVSIPPVQPQGSWFPLEEEINPRQQSRAPKEFNREPDSARYRKRSKHPSFMHGGENSVPSDRVLHETKRFPMQLHNGGERMRSNSSLSNFNSSQGEEMPITRNSSSHRDPHFDTRQATVKLTDSPAGVLQEIAMKCGNKMEFRSALCDTTELQFSIEVWFVGEKLGEGVGKTRKEAQHQAAEISLRYLADKYMSNSLGGPNSTFGDIPRLSQGKENGLLIDSNPYGFQPSSRNDHLPVASTSEDSRSMDQRLEGSRRTSAVTSLKELCVREGFNLIFNPVPSPSNGSVSKGEVSAQVEIEGQILGKGAGMTWEEAKVQAAEEALGTLRSMLGQFTQNQKRSSSPRSLPMMSSNKRFKPDFSRVFHRLPSSGRYSKSETPVP
ncbi:RNA polymerase II C-terminal domain phosphatase-like 1 [Canna indica]|uniref:protein-serine/threonine phosphatase n=1 Tax=Canna indica TaxID=4628 RepID=A0AAQ3KL02_9LILI|nr:RNA polymerase II C-terminal domain phosphatase-like 1 [Canna indica]